MTSNLVAREISDLVKGRIGFAAAKQPNALPADASDIDEKIRRTAVQAASRNFSPEFMNRIDKVVVFHSLNEQHLRQILELELRALQDRIMSSANTKFVFQCSDAVKKMLLREGIDYKYGARPLKRSIDRLLLLPLSNLVATGQVISGDAVFVDLNDSGSDVEFSKPYDERRINEAAGAALAAEYAGFIGAPAQSQLIGATV